MTNVEALKALYAALGGDPADVADASTIVEVLNAIAAKYEGDDDATLNPEAIANIAAVVGNIAPEPVLQNKTVTPTTSQQTITANVGYDGLGTVTVAAVTAAIDANIVAGNIKKDVEILGVTGSYEGTGVEFSAAPAEFTLLKNIINLDAVIPNGVTSIADNAFYYCTGLTSIEIPSSLTSINNSAFYGCTGLTSIEIPSSVTSINNNAFSGCTGLTSIEIPSSVTSIGITAFNGCTNLTAITVHKAEGSITGAPWGATNATVVWDG